MKEKLYILGTLRGTVPVDLFQRCTMCWYIACVHRQECIERQPCSYGARMTRVSLLSGGAHFRLITYPCGDTWKTVSCTMMWGEGVGGVDGTTSWMMYRSFRSRVSRHIDFPSHCTPTRWTICRSLREITVNFFISHLRVDGWRANTQYWSRWVGTQPMWRKWGWHVVLRSWAQTARCLGMVLWFGHQLDYLSLQS